MKHLIEVLRKHFALCLILFLGGVLLLFLSEYSLNTNNQSAGGISDASAYTEALENRLCSIISKMQGVSEVNVMIVLKENDSALIARETGGTPEGGNSGIFTSFSAHTDAGGQFPSQNSGLPRIAGVSVVCRGGGDAGVRKRISDLVASTLDLNQNQIFVTE